MPESDFIEVPCITYNNWEEDIMGTRKLDCEMVEIAKWIDKTKIESYGEAIPVKEFHENNKIWTTVTMHSGEDFIVNMPLSKFREHIKHAYA